MPERFQDYVTMARFAGVDVDKNELFWKAQRRYAAYDQGIELPYEPLPEGGPALSILLIDQQGHAFCNSGFILGSMKVRICLTALFDIFSFDGMNIAKMWRFALVFHLACLYDRIPDLTEYTLTIGHLQSMIRHRKDKRPRRTTVLHRYRQQRYDPAVPLNKVIDDLSTKFGKNAKTLPIRIQLLEEEDDVLECDLLPLYDFTTEAENDLPLLSLSETQESVDLDTSVDEDDLDLFHDLKLIAASDKHQMSEHLTQRRLMRVDIDEDLLSGWREQ